MRVAPYHSCVHSLAKFRWQEQSLYFLALDCFTRYMESPQSREFVYALQQREANGEQLPVRTVSVGLVSMSDLPYLDEVDSLIFLVACGGSLKVVMLLNGREFANSLIASADCVRQNIFHTLLLLCQDPDSPSYWMDMLKTMSETLRIGMVVSDMFVPGCPLAYLNEGFTVQTGTSERKGRRA